MLAVWLHRLTSTPMDLLVWTWQVAWVGLNEQEAQAKDLDFGVVRVEYHRAVRGIVSGEEGFLKMIYDARRLGPFSEGASR